MKKRILINLMLFGTGGGATHLLYLCSALAMQGVEVTLVSRHADPRTPVVRLSKNLPIRVITTPFAKDRRLYKLSTIWALIVWPILLRGRRYDLLYTWELSTFTRFLARFVRNEGHILLERAGEPLINNPAVDVSLRHLLNAVAVESTLQADAIRSLLESHTQILSLPLLGHCDAEDRNRKSQENVFRITFLGRYHSDKGIYRLLEIWPSLDSGLLELEMYGWGPEYENLKNLVREQGLDSEIRLNGIYETGSELRDILGSTDLVVLPSEAEGLPVVLLEAMAHGVPFVATDVGAVRTLAEDNPDVRVVPLDNDCIKEAIREMVAAIRQGHVDGRRLQTYYRKRFDGLAGKWIQAFVDPENSWHALSA